MALAVKSRPTWTMMGPNGPMFTTSSTCGGAKRNFLGRLIVEHGMTKWHAMHYDFSDIKEVKK